MSTKILAVIICVLYFSVWISSSTISFDQYCFVNCLINCTNSKERSAENCQLGCSALQQKLQLCKENVNCWKQNQCDVSTIEESFNSLPKPVVTFSGVTQEDPRKFLVQWSTVNDALFYFVQYNEVNDVNQTNDTWNFKIANVSNVTLSKSTLCSEYNVRVAGVSKNGIGEFSKLAHISKPIPNVMNPMVFVTDRVLVQKPYKDLAGAVIDNGTIRATFGFIPPPGFDLKTKEIVPAFLQPFLLGCKIKQAPLAMPQVIYDPNNDPYVYFDFPGFVIDSQCRFMITMSEIKTKCGTSYKIPPSNGILNVNFTCENTRNTTCQSQPEELNPTCNIPIMMNYSMDLVGPKFVPVHLNWSIPVGQKSSPIKCYLFNITESDKVSYSKELFFTKAPDVIREFPLINICATDGMVGTEIATETTISDFFERGKFYSVRICATYNKEFKKSIRWNLTSWTTLDLTPLKSSSAMRVFYFEMLFIVALLHRLYLVLL